MHYLYVLREVEDWTPELRDEYLRAFAVMRNFVGGEGMPKFQERIKQDFVESLDPPLRRRAWSILTENDEPTASEEPPRPLVQEWTLDDLADSLNDTDQQRNTERGKAMFKAAKCLRCHRVGMEGSAVGPDLTSVSRRFSRQDILDAILSPSKVVAENYRSDVITTVDGRVLTGRIVLSGDYRSPTLRVVIDPLDPSKTVEIKKAEIESHIRSPISRMPQGLLNTLSKSEVLDLLAFLETGTTTSSNK